MWSKLWTAWTAYTNMLFIFHLITTDIHFIACRESDISADLKLQRFSSSLAQSCQQCSLQCMHSSVTDLLIPVYDLSLCWQELFSLFQPQQSANYCTANYCTANHKSLWVRSVAHIQIEFVWLHLPNCFLMSKLLLIYALVVSIQGMSPGAYSVLCSVDGTSMALWWHFQGMSPCCLFALHGRWQYLDHAGAL